jgi:hypothetical protein
MNNKRSYPISTEFLLIFLILFNTSGSSYAAALEWNTFLGGSGSERGNVIAVDSRGNTYVCGNSGDWGSPIRAYTSGSDACVAKLSDNGTLVWNTFLGDSGYDECYGIAADGSGNIYVSGRSGSTWGTPLHAYTAGNDVFVAKLDSSGALTWNTFLGGSGNDSEGRLAVDAGGNIYVTGYSDATWGLPVGTYTEGIDAFVAKLDSSGSLTWNTFLGGSGTDYSMGITIDGSGNIYVSGESSTTWGFPVRGYTADDDGFVAKLDSSGSLTWNTFLGGSGDDFAENIAVENSGTIYVTGESDASWGSPVGAYTEGIDAFVAKLDSSGSLTWNTFLGGSGNDYGGAIAVDNGSNIFVAGYSDASWVHR